MRRLVSVVVAALLAVPPFSADSAPALGVIHGKVSLEGRPVSGIELVLIEMQSGATYRTSSRSGSFEARVAPGRYVVTTGSGSGLVIGRAPALLAVAAGQVASAQIDLVALAVPLTQEAPPMTPETAQAGAINFSPEITCFVAGEFPLLTSTVTPADKIARVRLYFKSVLGDALYYVEAVVGEGGVSVAKLPRPKIEASPVTYHWQVAFTDFGELTYKEIDAIVVDDAEKCEDRPVAPFGPAGPVQVFSAATGAAVSPAGFAAGIGGAVIAAIIIGAVALGIAGGIIISNPSPTPTPRPTPTPTPTPTPGPTPTPTPTPSPSPPPPASPFK